MKNRRKQVGSCLHDTQQKRTTSTLQASYHDTRHGWGGGHNSSRVWRWRGSWTSVLSTENSGVPFLSNIQGRFLLTLVHTISYSVKKRVMTSKEKKNLKEVTKKENPVGVFVMKIKRNTKCYKSDKEKPVSQSVFRPYSQCALGERLSFQCLSFVRE